MRFPTLIATLLTLSACASAPKPPAPAPEPNASAQQKTVVCSGGAMALIAITKPWGLKDCVSGSGE